jgi:hypothetical protein
MRFYLYVAALMALTVLNAKSSLAGESVTGRWAGNPSSCEGFAGIGAQSLLVVTNYAVRWQGDSCRIGRMYKTGDTTYIQALCWSGVGEKSIPVSLHQHAGRLMVTWDRGAHRDLQRCP